MRLPSLLIRAVALAAAVLPAAPVLAQPYPNKPVRLIVTFPPGGTPDIYGRILAQELAAAWKQNVVVENKTGASGTIGTDFVAKAPPDGYTLLFAADASITIAPNLLRATPYHPVRDLTAIVNVAAGPFVLLANPAFPAADMKEFIALAKQQPGRISYASSGAGGQQHLSMETVRHLAGIDVAHVPYKGFGQGLGDVMAGHVPLIFGGITASIALTRSGKLKALGVTSAKRSPALPQVQAIAETLPGFRIEAWYGFMGPPAMARELVARINADVAAIVRRPDFQKRLTDDALESIVGTPEDFAAQVRTDLESWARLIKAVNVKVE
ncbi:MAG: tripartite tricarboxylate transporter substrate binding protein [Burkholderiales bacterium]|nr:tripartite tricarboxylate transporter substrate binding protein [Burkholderiales bacterium]